MCQLTYLMRDTIERDLSTLIKAESSSDEATAPISVQFIFPTKYKGPCGGNANARAILHMAII